MRLQLVVTAMVLWATAGTVTPAAAQTAVTPPATTTTSPTDSSPRITVGGFVDTYYAWDFGRPPSQDRSFVGGALFTTQPARHNEFNLNLAFVELKLDAPHYRGRLAIQAGTSVQSNYAGEPTNGAVSGPALSRLVQEAVVGVQLAPTVWIDGGVFFSHMGTESWISRDNPTYTRSLVAEYSPYYQSGAKITWTPSARLTAQLNVVNGWQNISENNQGKGAGVRVDWQTSDAGTVSYYNFVSQENGSRLRSFNGVGLKQVVGRATILTEFDVGTQARSASQTTAVWSGATAVLKVQTSRRAALSLRVEGYRDLDQAVLSTGSSDGVANAGFRGVGASVGADFTPYPHVIWRTEMRVFHAGSALFPSGAGSARSDNALAVTSLAVTF